MEQTLEIVVPDTWADVTLSQYMAFMKSLKPYEGSELYGQVMLEKAAAHFCNIPLEVLIKMPIEDYKSITSYLQQLFDFGKDLPIVKDFEMGTTKYGFIPKLDEMTYGEYLDLTTYFKDMWDNMPTIMSVLYRPIVQQDVRGYKIKPYSGTTEDTEELFKNFITMDIVWGAIGFFTSLQNDLLNVIQTYSLKILKKEMNKKNSPLMEILTTNGVDISQLQSLQETISQNLTK